MRNFALDVWEDLRAKRLWPVAVVLLVALLAVPLLLLKGKPQAARPDTGSTAHTAAQLPIVGPDPSSMSGSSRLDALGPKNPFAPRGDKVRGVATATSSATGAAPASGPGAAGASPSPGGSSSGGPGAGAGGGSGSAGSGSGGSGSGGGSGGGSGSPAPATGGSAPPPATVTYYTWRADVEFGLKGNESRRSLQGVTPLTGRNGRIVLVYLGQSETGESVFLVNQELHVTGGSSNCRPDAQHCAFVYLLPQGGRNDVLIEDKADGGAVYHLKLLDVQRVADNRGATGQSNSKARQRQAKLDTSRKARRGLTPFDFHIPLTDGSRG